MAKSPMDEATEFKEAKARVNALKEQLVDAGKEADRLEARMLELIEAGQLPASFKVGTNPVYTSEEMYASPRDKDHQAVVRVLESLGVHELLPNKVNSQSLSGYVREFRDDIGDLVMQDDEHPDGLPQELAAVLTISRKTRVKINGV